MVAYCEGYVSAMRKEEGDESDRDADCIRLAYLAGRQKARDDLLLLQQQQQQQQQINNNDNTNEHAVAANLAYCVSVLESNTRNGVVWRSS